MVDSLTRRAGKWLNFYYDYVSEWWADITFSQYMVLMLVGLACGWLLLKSSVRSAG